MTNSSRYKLFKHADFIILDMVMVVAAYILAIGTRFGFDYISAVGFYRANIATVIVFCIIIDLIYPFYRDILHRSRLNEVKMTFLYVTSIVIIMIVFNFFLHNLWMYSRLVVFLFWVYACADVYIARLALKNFIKLRMKNSAYLPRVLLICSDSHLDEYLQYLNDHKGTRFRIAAAFVAVRHDKRMKLPVSVTFNNNVLIKEYETDPALSLFDDDRAQQDGNRPHQADDADLIHDVTDKGDDSDRISDVNNKDD
ncbi:MAG: hypothetical protein VZR23_08720, partial [Lachnospiraceae bacterium]|nr:hypothetical protein [Lachnospiraceae bacterium]